ncbi:MAG TPA: HK97 family phage prohead protease [Tepidisphaeraceae bacterium]|jgi:HK97 family phage prohead protease
MNQRDVCYHEASHALAARLLGVTVKSVSVNANLPDGLMAHGECTPDQNTVIALAGMIGATIADCGPDVKRLSPGDRRGLTLPTDRTDADRYIDRMSALTIKLLQRNWSDVERLADALAERGRMTGHEVNALLAKTPTHRKGVTADVTLSPDDRRTVVAVVNTPTVDRDGEVVEPGGANVDEYRVNPVLLYQHDYQTLPVGRCVALDVTDDRMTAKFQFAERPDDYPADQEWLPDTLLALYRQRIMRSFSIGFIPVTTRAATANDMRRYGADCRRVIEEWTLLEISAVSIPSNPDAVAIATSKHVKRVFRTVNLPSRKARVKHVHRIMAAAEWGG